MMVLVQLKQNHVPAVVYVMIQVVNANVSKDTLVLTAASKMHWLYKKKKLYGIRSNVSVEKAGTNHFTIQRSVYILMSYVRSTYYIICIIMEYAYYNIIL